MNYEKIFRAYDIRGIYPTEINELFAYELGRALATYFGNTRNRKVVVGNDVRTSSEVLKHSLIQGLIESGLEVFDIGLYPTPIISFATKQLKARFGVTISASHNPKEWNGFIINNSNGLTLGFGFGLEKIKKILEEKKFKKSKKTGRITKFNIENEYIKFLMKKFNFEGDLTIILDCGNGSASEILPKILKIFNKGNNIELFCRCDGRFPNRDPEPKKESLYKLVEKVLIEKADIGFAYDGDADRMVVVDDLGNILLPHQILSLFLRSYGNRMKNKKVVIEVLSSLAAMDEIRKFKAKPIVSKVGRSFIQNEMFKNKAFLAAEVSYHFYFRESFYLDDTIFATLKILNFLTNVKRKLSHIIREIPVYFYESRRIEVRDDIKFKFVESLKNDFKDYKIEEIDGIKIWLDDESWLAVRASNTEPKISLVYESKKNDRFEELKQIAEKVIEKIKRV